MHRPSRSCIAMVVLSALALAACGTAAAGAAGASGGAGGSGAAGGSGGGGATDDPMTPEEQSVEDLLVAQCPPGSVLLTDDGLGPGGVFRGRDGLVLERQASVELCLPLVKSRAFLLLEAQPHLGTSEPEVNVELRAQDGGLGPLTFGFGLQESLSWPGGGAWPQGVYVLKLTRGDGIPSAACAGSPAACEATMAFDVHWRTVLPPPAEERDCPPDAIEIPLSDFVDDGLLTVSHPKAAAGRYCLAVRKPLWGLALSVTDLLAAGCGTTTTRLTPPAYRGRPVILTTAPASMRVVESSPGRGFIEPGAWLLDLAPNAACGSRIGWWAHSEWRTPLGNVACNKGKLPPLNAPGFPGWFGYLKTFFAPGETQTHCFDLTTDTDRLTFAVVDRSGAKQCSYHTARYAGPGGAAIAPELVLDTQTNSVARFRTPDGSLLPKGIWQMEITVSPDYEVGCGTVELDAHPD